MEREIDYLVVGASGMLGSRLLETLAQSSRVAGTHYRHPVHGTYACDLAEETSVRAVLSRAQARVLVHVGGMTRPDDCEARPSYAFAVNVGGMETMLRHFSGEKVILFSTDYVFDGECAPYDVDAETRPLNVYGATKAEAEKVLLELLPSSLVVRVAGLYGWSGGNREFLIRMRSQPLIVASKDHYSSYTWIDDICHVLPSLESLSGIIHLVGPESYARAEFTRLACEFLSPSTQVKPVDGATAYAGARRPRNSTLVPSAVSANFASALEALGRLRDALGREGIRGVRET